jgi:hypothetical protein
MKKSIRLLVGILVPAFMLAGVVASPALAQDKAKAAPAAKAEKGGAKMTVVMENDKVRVYEVLFKPGDQNKAVPSANSRVIRATKGGTLMRTYTDGKTENIVYKANETKFVEATKVAYTAKNVGKTDVQLYVVMLK